MPSRAIRDTVAYWISPCGDLVEVEHNHIGTVIDYPQAFGYTLARIQNCYDAHGEAMRVEGNAREEIIRDLVNHGFIRIRRYRREGYSVNIGRLDLKTKQILCAWARKMIGDGLFGRNDRDVHMPVNVLVFGHGPLPQLTLLEVSRGALFAPEEPLEFPLSLIPVASAADFTTT